MKTLIIGNKNYSSWSLRAWLILKEFQVPFIEKRIPLFTEGYKQDILAYSPSGLVPALVDEDRVIWDSLAIGEYIADFHPDLACWPRDIHTRAMARSISHEMHSGFALIRSTLPMNCKKNIVFTDISLELQAEIDRVCSIWKTCREQHSSAGAFLFGNFTIADAMYAPVVLRFNSYGIVVGAAERDYMQAILGLGGLQEWVGAALTEKESLDVYEVDD